MEVPEFLIPFLGFLAFFLKPMISWSVAWRPAFLLGILGFWLGSSLDRAFRGDY